ncbi:hypothetical protein C1646_761756 [Rhizophagus diaphanus]|nr:hypothetical protein C1646_761756 [Rhizophagus diaphanus] [Rhizophagus sp. MUCL 43196]
MILISCQVLTEAQKLDQEKLPCTDAGNHSSFWCMGAQTLSLVESERNRNGLQSYWKGIIKHLKGICVQNYFIGNTIYLYNYVYREYTKLALASTLVAGRREKCKIILNFMVEKMEGIIQMPGKDGSTEIYQTALCLRYLLLYIDKKILLRTGIMIAHLGNTSNDEFKAFSIEVFSVRAAERMIKLLHLTSNGCISDVLLQGMIYYRENDEIDGIEPLDSV